VGVAAATDGGGISRAVFPAHEAALLVLTSPSSSSPRSSGPTEASPTPADTAATASTDSPTKTSSNGSSGGLEVLVPATPNQHALLGLCTAFLAGRDGATT